MSTTTLETAAPADALAAGREDADLAAFNAAFRSLDLDWHWDRDVYRHLPHRGDDRETLGAWLRDHRPHLLTVYDVAFLCDAVLAAKQRHRAPAAGKMP